MRRVHLRGRVPKRYQIHVAAANLGIVLRQLIGWGTPRGFQGRKALLADALSSLLASARALIAGLLTQLGLSRSHRDTTPNLQLAVA